MEQTRRCRHHGRAGGLARAASPDNRADRLALRAGALALAACALSACSLSFPISGIAADETPTGSIDRTATLLSPALDREDLRRARASLAVALDPQGNGARVAWQNPQTGAHGAFAAAAPPFPDHDRVCRAFSGEIVAGPAGARRLSGSACRDGDGTWQLRDVEVAAKA